MPRTNITQPQLCYKSQNWMGFFFCSLYKIEESIVSRALCCLLLSRYKELAKTF